jgi:hypothetical protein
MRTAATEDADTAAAVYRAAAARLRGSGMPGVETGLEALAILCLRIAHDEPPAPGDPVDWGPYEPWARPILLCADGDRDAARAALHRTPKPPHDHLQESLWTLTARAAVDLGDLAALRRSRAALAPARLELAGAASAMLTAGPVEHHLAELDTAIATLA